MVIFCRVLTTLLQIQSPICSSLFLWPLYSLSTSPSSIRSNFSGFYSTMNSFFASITSSSSTNQENEKNDNEMERRLNEVLSTISSNHFEAIVNQLLWSNNDNNTTVIEEEEEKITFVITLVARIARTKREFASLLMRCIITVGTKFYSHFHSLHSHSHSHFHSLSTISMNIISRQYNPISPSRLLSIISIYFSLIKQISFPLSYLLFYLSCSPFFIPSPILILFVVYVFFRSFKIFQIYPLRLFSRLFRRLLVSFKPF